MKNAKYDNEGKAVIEENDEWREEKVYLLYRCSRYDLQGKEILKTQEKFYLADTALRYSVLGYNPDSVASSLEYACCGFPFKKMKWRIIITCIFYTLMM